VVGHDRPELAIAPELPAPVPDPAASSPMLGTVRVIRPGPGIPVPLDLPADRGRRATEPGSVARTPRPRISSSAIEIRSASDTYRADTGSAGRVVAGCVRTLPVRVVTDRPYRQR